MGEIRNELMVARIEILELCESKYPALFKNNEILINTNARMQQRRATYDAFKTPAYSYR
jgi:hypothetical protein